MTQRREKVVLTIVEKEQSPHGRANRGDASQFSSV